MKGFYKKESTRYLYAPKNVYLPNGNILNESNKMNEYGWEWKEEAPEGYINESTEDEE